ncbi:unnamed protein product [Cuscuta europaea]|uniref:Zinc knuckle CX2CX4HX4C domain-containing protein n=1 Tax=Cuscuta europaea TaxID=41803 RepID=A0A9P0ZPA2_CUSEU|nr:unnamed protein product [Cuscuta europaea]
MRIRVCMDIRKPLKKGTTLKKGGIGHWVDFKYEKLPNFCFICGIIDHSDKFCLVVYEGDNTLLDKFYGVHLRAGGRGRLVLLEAISGYLNGPQVHRYRNTA